MAQLNFQKDFEASLEDGSKLQTVRRYRLDGQNPKKGDRLTLVVYPYSKKRRVVRDTVCTMSRSVIVRSHRVELGPPNMQGQPSPESFALVTGAALDAFAENEGFPYFDAMAIWFRKSSGLPFRGRLISWDPELEEI